MKSLSLALSGLFIGNIVTFPASAQITTDGTTSTTVTPTATGVQIDDGNRAGGNLFHSFGEFSVSTGREAYFNNANDIVNIFSRVTGGNISNIDGLLRANGTANLFLINPAGILFGENASLQLGGSFYGSTADSIVFPDGEFSATDLENPPLITINAPIGLNFRDNPGNITNRANFGLTEEVITPGTETEYKAITSMTGLEVNEGERLALIGGDIRLERSGLTAPGGYIELGGLSQVGTVGINSDGSLSFPEAIARSDVNLTDNAKVDIRGNGGGSLKVNARNLTLADKSRLFTGIREGMGFPEAIAGDVIINATESVKLFASGDFDTGTRLQRVPLRIDTAIISWVGLPPELRQNPDKVSTGRGQGGSIIVDTPLLEMTTRDTGILNFSYGRGNTGSISITANSINLDNTVIGAFVLGGIGNAGDIKIKANDITLENRGGIISQILNNGKGNAGNIKVITTDSFSATGSYIGADNSGQGEGNGGNIYIKSGNSLTLDSVVAEAVVRENVSGNAGNITLKAFNIDINGNSDIPTTIPRTQSFIGADPRNIGKGNAGNVNIEASSLLKLDEVILRTQIGATTEGNAGNIILKAPTINLNQTEALANTEGNGQAGNIEIVTNFLFLDNSTIKADNQPSTNTLQKQQGGNINLSIAKNIFLRNNSTISTKAGKNVAGGNVNINADFIVAYLSNDNGNGNDILADAEQAEGGKIKITADALFGIEERKAFDGNATNDIDASSDLDGLNGTVSINTPDNNPIRENIEQTQDVITSQVETTDVCSISETGVISGLVVKGKGGIPPQPTEPMNADNLIVDSEITSDASQNNNSQNNNNVGTFHGTSLQNSEEIPSHIQPVAYRDNGEPIYLARGVIVQEDGSVILTAYETDRTKSRIPYHSYGCN
jgi:filamentous hemagglutinin family protein